MDKYKRSEYNEYPSVCGLVHTCSVSPKKCIHKEPHQFTDACKGMCKHMGYADCRPIKKNHVQV